MKKMMEGMWLRWAAAGLMFLMVIAIIVGTLALLTDIGLAEEEEIGPSDLVGEGEDFIEDYPDVWVLCGFNGHVNIRDNPRKTATTCGSAGCGARLKTDGNTKNGYLHVLDLAAEASEGWISLGYISYTEPVLLNQYACVVSNGRLRARKYIGGRVNTWLKPGDEINVVYWSEDWCVTAFGFVQTEYLELIGD